MCDSTELPSGAKAFHWDDWSGNITLYDASETDSTGGVTLHVQDVVRLAELIRGKSVDGV